MNKLTEEQQALKTRLNEVEAARTQAQNQVRTHSLNQNPDRTAEGQRVCLCMQVVRADAALSVVQAQHLRQLQDVQQQMGSGFREEAELLQAQLVEEQRRSQQLEETLRLQVQQSSSQISIKQVKRAEVKGQRQIKHGQCV